MDKNNEDRIDQLQDVLDDINTSENHHRLVERDLRRTTSLLQNKGRREHMTANQMYLIDNSFSRNPVAKCDQASIGITACKKCDNKMCYWKGKCIDQLDMDGNPLYPEERSRVFAKTIKAGVDKYDPREIDRLAGDMAYALVAMESDKLDGKEV